MKNPNQEVYKLYYPYLNYLNTKITSFDYHPFGKKTKKFELKLKLLLNQCYVTLGTSDGEIIVLTQLENLIKIPKIQTMLQQFGENIKKIVIY